MARALRMEYPGALHYVTAQGNARGAICLDDGDRRHFLALLTEVVRTHGWTCHAWCLLDDHYHLMIETAEPNLGQGMRQLNGVYTQRFNRGHERTGHVFQGRYKAVLVERGPYWLELARHVVLNPVRAGLVAVAGEWQWSSYRATAISSHVPGTPSMLLGPTLPGRIGSSASSVARTGSPVPHIAAMSMPEPRPPRNSSSVNLGGRFSAARRSLKSSRPGTPTRTPDRACLGKDGRVHRWKRFGIDIASAEHR